MCVSHSGATFCTAPFLNFEISNQDLTVRVNGSVNRMVSRIENGVAKCQEKRKRYCWFLIKLVQTEYFPHSNALLIDLEQNESWLFEPYGSDPKDFLHGGGFVHL